MKLFKKIKQCREVLLEVLCYIFAVILFVGGYQYADKYITKELTDEQYSICNQYVHDIYTNNEANIIDIPNDMYFEDRLMEVGVNHHYGCAKATYQNGKLIIEREYEKMPVIAINCLFGFIAIIIGAILKALIKYFYKQFDECKIKG